MKDRLDTFLDDSWPYSEESDPLAPSANALAQAGFFYIGLSDRVQCFVCQIVLDGWKTMPAEDTNDPWAVHARANPGCAYIERNSNTKSLASPAIVKSEENK